MKKLTYVLGACALTVVSGSSAQAVVRCEQSPYANFSTAPSYIRVQMPDAESVTVKTLILPNYSFGMFWLERHGIKRGGSGDGTAIRSRYVPFMEEHEGRPLDIDIAEFVRWVEERGHGGKQMTHEEVRKAVERLPDVLGYSLSELGFADRDELLAAISTIEKGRVRAKAGPREHISVWDKRFIALLLDQDISFSHGDIILVPYFCDRSER